MAVVLFAAIATNVGGQMSIATIASTLFIGKDAGIKDEDAALASVGKFAAFIHPVIIQPSMPKGKHRPVLSPRELMEFRCQNMRVIDMFLYGVATGNSQVDTDKILSAGNQDHQSNFLAAAVVSSDVMMRGRVPHPFHDYFVELSVKDLREYTGKVYYQGLGAELEYLTATIPERDGERNDARTLRDKDATSRSSDRYGIRINEYLGKLVTKITEMKLWRAGEDPVVRGEKTSETITCSSDVITLPGGVELPSLNLSSIMDVGGKRLDRYFVRWYIDSYGAVERSEKGLAKLKTTKKDLKAAMDLDIKLATSTSDLMVRECTKELLLIQIERMRDRNKARPKNNKQLRIPDDKLDKNTKKGIIVDFLTTWRIKEFRAFPKLKGTLVNQIMKERGDSNVILEADRKKLMGSEFFSLSKYMEGNDAYSSIHE
uniref:Uncharacterized protein n=1 Tax=Skeletonema marinoi TaxID=267567 RepID=A0A7S2KM63_9STRA|mmetsp:Transcript_14189/g.23715  ORF Transcript_14189/g.23715 Transcript_14189/m.23715 type:complete len:430 (+) Transcript_14189:507-1796(+)